MSGHIVVRPASLAAALFLSSVLAAAAAHAAARETFAVDYIVSAQRERRIASGRRHE